MTLWLLEILPTVAVNVVEVAPAGTVTELGTGSSELLLDSKTSEPPVGAAPLNVTVHVVVAPGFRLVGLQTSWETETTCPKAAPESKRRPIVGPPTLVHVRLGINHLNATA
jgi:hypothetical protein